MTPSGLLQNTPEISHQLSSGQMKGVNTRIAGRSESNHFGRMEKSPLRCVRRWMSPYAFISCLALPILPQGQVSVLFSKNPVYANEDVTLIVKFDKSYDLTTVTIEAFNGTRNEGVLYCFKPTGNVTGTGVFVGSRFIRCPLYAGRVGTVEVPMQALQLLELDYNCSVRLNRNYQYYEFSSNITRLTVNILPSIPKFLQIPIVFNESDNATIVCDSRGGKPEVTMTLVARSVSGLEATVNSSNALVLPPPLSIWHNAVATCSVTNHNFSNNSVSSIVVINHITIISIPSVVQTHESMARIDCSNFISGYPGVYYRWSALPNASATDPSLISSPILSLRQGEAGLYNCTATNNITRKTVAVVLISRNVPTPSKGNFVGSEFGTTVPIVYCVIVVVALFSFVQ